MAGDDVLTVDAANAGDTADAEPITGSNSKTSVDGEGVVAGRVSQFREVDIHPKLGAIEYNPQFLRALSAGVALWHNTGPLFGLGERPPAPRPWLVCATVLTSLALVLWDLQASRT